MATVVNMPPMDASTLPEQRDAFGYTEKEREQMFRAVERCAEFMRLRENEPNVSYEKRWDLNDEERYGELPERGDPQTGFVEER